MDFHFWWHTLAHTHTDAHARTHTHTSTHAPVLYTLSMNSPSLTLSRVFSHTRSECTRRSQSFSTAMGLLGFFSTVFLADVFGDMAYFAGLLRCGTNRLLRWLTSLAYFAGFDYLHAIPAPFMVLDVKMYNRHHFHVSGCSKDENTGFL